MSNRLYQVCTTRSAVIVMVLALAVSESSGISYYTDDYNKVNSATLHEPIDLLHPSRNSTMSVVSGAAGDVFRGSAAIIAEDWIVTAKHVVAPLINDPTLGFKVAGVGSTYRPDIESNVPMIFLHEDELIDIAIVRVVTANGQDANFSNWIPIATPPPIATVTIGGYGSYFPEQNPGAETTGSLHWGRNVAHTDHSSGRLFALAHSPPEPRYISYEGNTQSGDSGGGWFFRDGWDWRIAAETQSGGADPSVAMSVFTDEVIGWLNANMGTEFPSPASPTSVPAPNRTWNGSGHNWSMSSSWTGGLPDGLAIAKIYSSVAISSSTGVATAGDLYVMSQSGLNGSISQSGGELKATWDIFMAPESDDAVTYYLSAGTLSAEQLHVGFRGQGTVFQSGGGVVAKSGVLVGTDNDGASYPSYYLISAGSLTTQGLQLGVKPGAEGNFSMLSTGTATVTSHLVQIGYRGTGAFSQTKGTVSAEHVELGGEAGSSGSYQLSGTGSLTVGSSTIVGRNGTASFVQSGGNHTTSQLAINAVSTYTLSGGVLDVTGPGLSNSGALQLTGGDVDTVIYNQSGNESALIVELAATPNSNDTLSADGLAKLQSGKLQLNIDESLIDDLTIGDTVFSIIDAPNVQGEFHEVVYGDATFADFFAQDRALAVKYVGESFNGGVRSSEGVEVHIATPGDFNFNGVVDLDDLIILSANFNDPGVYSWSQGDIDGDGDVDLDDLTHFSVYFNQGSGAGGGSQIPEPSSFVISVVALLSVLTYARCK